MALEVNGARGEVPLTVGGVDLVIAATMKGLAGTSTAIGCQSLGELFLKIQGVEVATTIAAIGNLTVRGDKDKALEALTVKDFPACADAFAKALSHHFQGEPKNDEAAETKA